MSPGRMVVDYRKLLWALLTTVGFTVIRTQLLNGFGTLDVGIIFVVVVAGLALAVDRQPAADPRPQQVIDRDRFSDRGIADPLLESAELVLTLENLYPASPMFDFNGHKWAITVLHEFGDLIPSTPEAIDRILDELDLRAPDASFADDRHDPNLEDLHDHIVDECATAQAQSRGGNRIGYMLERLELSDGPRLHTRLGTFALAQATSFSLGTELLTALDRYRSHRRALQPVRIVDLPARQRVHRLTQGAPLVDGRGRDAEIAVSVFTVLEGADGAQALILRRSNEVATDKGRLHVAPAGKFQRSGELPEGLEEDYQYSLYLTVLREFGEELLNTPELQFDEAFELRSPWEHPVIQKLDSCVLDQTIEIIPTSIAGSLFDLQIEVTFLMVVKQMSGLIDRIKPNWEFMPLDQLPPGDRKRVRFRLTNDLELPASSFERLSPSQLLPRGAVAIGLGLPAYRRLVESRDA